MTEERILSVSPAEAELLELVRGVGPREFSITVTQIGGVCTVKVVDVAAGIISEGQGATFDQAWIDQCDPALRGPLSLREKFTLRRFRVVEGDKQPR